MAFRFSSSKPRSQREGEKKGSGQDAAMRGKDAATRDQIGNDLVQFFRKTNLFDRQAYLGTYSDVPKVGPDPLIHFARFGVHLGRSFTSEIRVAKVLREVLRSQGYVQSQKAALDPAPVVKSPERFKVGVFVSSLGNFFMTEIADIITFGLKAQGASAERFSENDTPPRDLTHRIVVAPHEFFLLGEGPKWTDDAFLTKATLFTTEQVQSPWFARSLPYLLRAQAIIDINYQNAAIFEGAGLRAICIQPGYSPDYAPYGPRADMSSDAALAGYSREIQSFDGTTGPLAKRPLDVVFLGTHSPRREKVLAGYVPAFSEMSTFIYYTRMTRPLTGATTITAEPEITAGLLQRAKVLLNVHRDDFAYFEWWRLVQAFWQKTPVVTEPCFPHPLFKPGKHYLEETRRHIPELIKWLNGSRDGAAKADEVRRAAFEELRTRASLAESSARILAFLESAS